MLIAQLLRRAENVYRMVGDALKVTDGFEDSGRLLALGASHLGRADLDKVAAEDILVLIAFVFIAADALGKSRSIAGEAADRVFERTRSGSRHLERYLSALVKRKRGGDEQALVEQALLFIFTVMLLAVGHNNADELFEQTAEREH